MKACALRLVSPILLFGIVTGCSVSSTRDSIATPGKLAGVIHGGQQPVVGAVIQLYTVGTTADGSSATPLLSQTVTSDSTGSFNITGLYNCSNATQVYLTATGGNPGLSSANPNLVMMTALGSCTAAQSIPFVWIDELTTVAAAYALAPYATSATSIGSGTSDAAALATAFTLASEYVNPTTGQAPGTGIPSGYTDPTALLNTLADILATCINSSGGTAGVGTTPCGALFSLTANASGTPPSDTFTALLNLVANPMQNTAAIFNLVASNAPFLPDLPTVPPDFNVRLTSPNSPYLHISPYPAYGFADEAIGGPTEVLGTGIFNQTRGADYDHRV